VFLTYRLDGDINRFLGWKHTGRKGERQGRFAGNLMNGFKKPGFLWRSWQIHALIGVRASAFYNILTRKPIFIPGGDKLDCREHWV